MVWVSYLRRLSVFRRRILPLNKRCEKDTVFGIEIKVVLLKNLVLNKQPHNFWHSNIYPNLASI
jgi:hypothetical protein